MSPSSTEVITLIVLIFLVVAAVLTVIAAVVAAIFLLVYRLPRALSRRTRIRGPEARFSSTRAVVVFVLTIVIAAGSIMMVGPQILVIVLVALLAGIVFALRRSFWALVCFGYPFTFGLIFAWEEYTNLPDFKRTPAFAILIGMGLLGCVLIAVGLWKALPGRKKPVSAAARGGIQA